MKINLKPNAVKRIFIKKAEIQWVEIKLISTHFFMVKIRPFQLKLILLGYFFNS